MALSKAKLKHLRSLQNSKFRQKYNNFTVEGEKMVGELLAQSRLPVEEIFALPEWIAANARALAALPPARLHEVSDGELRQISSLTTPNRVFAVVCMPAERPDAALIRSDYTLYLDGIRDPGNLGTIWRIADWFGFPYLFCSPDCVDRYNPKVIQASMGAFLRVDAFERPFTWLRDGFPDLPVLGAVLDGEDVFRLPLPGHGVLVIGSEARGLSPEVLPCLTHRLSIPSAPGGGAESLNAAVAAGIMGAVLRNRANDKG